MNEKKILLADDDPAIREVLCLLLSGEGYTAVEAANGQEVLSLLDDTVDLVILDIMMPGMSGYTVCTEIRKRSAVPILFLTATMPSVICSISGSLQPPVLWPF